MTRALAFLIALTTVGSLAALVPARAQDATTPQRISGTIFEHMAKHALASVELSSDESLIQASPVRDQFVAPGSVALTAESPLVNASYVNVPIEISLNGVYLRTLFVGYRVQQYVQTAVAAHDLVAGSVLERGDVAMARVPSFGRLPNGTDVLIGRKVFEAFRKGEPIYMEETQTNQIVKAGSMVVLIVNDGGVSVVTEVEARTGGGLGDEVSLYNSATNKMLSGTVIGPDRVELDVMGAQRQ